MEEQENAEKCEDASKGYREQIERNLRSKYTSFAVSQLPWADGNNVSFQECEFNLRVIRKDYYYNEFEISSTAIGLEDIFAPTENSDLLFNDGPSNEEPTRILVEADSGYGKTTLAKKIANDWALGSNDTFSAFDLVFVIPLRNIQGNLIGSLIKQASLEGASDEDVLKAICLNSTRVLMMLDGFDELSKDDEEVLLAVWSGDQFADCRVIMTTIPSKMPPASTPGWPKRKDILLQGLTQTQKNEFLKAYDRSIVGDSILLSPLQKLPDFYDSPLMLSMAVFLPAKKELPVTKTELFQDVWDFIIEKAVGEVLSPVDLFGRQGDAKPKQAVTFLNQFGKIALKALMKGCLTFTKDEVPELLLSENDDNVAIGCVDLGFLFNQNEVTHFGFDDGMLEPVHKSLLDFAASYHLSRLVHYQNQGETLEHFREQVLQLGPERVFGSDLLLFLSGLLGEKVHILYDIFSPLSKDKFENFMRKQHFLELFSSYAESRNQQSSMQQLYQFNDTSSDNIYIHKLKSPVIVDLEIQCRAVQLNFNLQGDQLWPKSSLDSSAEGIFQLRVYVADMIINTKNFFSFLDLLSYKCDRLHFINSRESEHVNMQGTLPCILTEVKYWYSKHFNPWQNLCFHKCEITDRTLQLIHAITADGIEMLQFQKPVLVSCPIFTSKDIEMFCSHSGLRYVSFESLDLHQDEFKSICQNFCKGNAEIFGVELKPKRRLKIESEVEEWDPYSPTVKFHGKIGKSTNIFVDNINIRNRLTLASVSDVIQCLTSGEMFQMKSLQLKSVETSSEDVQILCEVASRCSSVTHFTVLQPDRHYAVHFTCNESKTDWDIIIIRDLSLLSHFTFPEESFSVSSLMITGEDSTTHDSRSLSIIDNLLSSPQCRLNSLILQQITLTEEETQQICKSAKDSSLQRISINFTEFRYVDLPLLCNNGHKSWENINLQNVIVSSDDITSVCTSFSVDPLRIKSISFYDTKLIANELHSPRQTLFIDNDPTLCFKFHLPFGEMSLSLNNVRVIRSSDSGQFLGSPEIFSIFVNPEFKIELFEFDCSAEISPGAVELFNDTMANTSVLKKVSILSNGTTLLKIPEEAEENDSSFRLPSPNRIVHLTVKQSFNTISTNMSEQLFGKLLEFLSSSQCELEILRLKSIDFDQEQVEKLCDFVSGLNKLKNVSFEFKEARQVDLMKLCNGGKKEWNSISLIKASIKQPVNPAPEQYNIDELFLKDMGGECIELKQNLLNCGVKNIHMSDKQLLRDPDLMICFE